MAAPLKVFSPSATIAYGFCPRKRGFDRARLKPRIIIYPEIAAITGTAVAAGLETLYKGRMVGKVLAPEVYTSVALDVARREKDIALAGGARYVAIKDRERWDEIENSVERVLKTHARVDPFKDYKVVSVEEPNEDFHDRVDVVLEDANGLLVVDFKVRLTLKAEWVRSEQDKWARSWQLRHYTVTRQASRYAVALIAPQTRQGVYYEIIPVSEADGKRFIRDAVAIWDEMAQAEIRPIEDLRPNPSHANEFGECEFWREACQYNLDPAMMTQNLVRVDRPKR